MRTVPFLVLALVAGVASLACVEDYGLAGEPSPGAAAATPSAPSSRITAIPTKPAPTPRATGTPVCPNPYVSISQPKPAPSATGTPGPVRVPHGEVAPPTPFATPSPLPKMSPDSSLEAKLREALGPDIDDFAIMVRNLKTGKEVAINADRAMLTASVFKVWVMYEAYRQASLGALSFGEQWRMTDYYDGFGMGPRGTSLCEEASITTLLNAMMTVSDNSAAVLLMDRAGAGNVNNSLAALGFETSRLTEDGVPHSTARELAYMMEYIARGQAVSAQASASMVELMSHEVNTDRIVDKLPPGTRVAHKTGNLNNATNDAGIVYAPNGEYVIVMLSTRGYDNYPGLKMSQLSRLVYDWYNATP